MLDVSRYDPPRLVAAALMAVVGGSYLLQPGGQPFTALQLINLVPNQLGHLLFLVFGGFISYFGGPVVQVAFPASLFFYLYTSRKPFLSSLAVFWAAQNLFEVAVYARDARTLTFSLVGGPDHVWNVLLGWLRLLQLEQFVANTLYLSGGLALAAALFIALLASRKAP